MTHYLWKGINKKGKIKKGNISTDSIEQLNNILLKQEIALISFKTDPFYLRFLSFLKKRKQISTEQLTSFFHHLSLLLKSGISLIDALKLSKNHIQSKPFEKTISAIIKEIKTGLTFSASVKKHSPPFTLFITQIIKSGEQSGALDISLENLSSYLKMQNSLIRKLKQAALLPIITFIFTIIIISGIFIFIIPQFEPLFNTMKQQLPTSTKFILKISALCQKENIIYIIGILILATAIIKIIKKHKSITNYKDKIILHIPIISRIIILFNLVNFIQTLSILLKSGNPIKQSITKANKVFSNNFLRKKTELITNYIEQGQSLEQAFKSTNNKFIPESLISAIAIGEQTGKLEIMLERSALFFQEALNDNIHFITTIFQPILLIFLGLIIGLLILSIYIPIFNTANIL